MFKLEREMIPVLQEGLANMYNTEHFISEFNSGNGIADLVFSLDIKKQELILNYEHIFLILKYINRRNKIIDINRISDEINYKKSKLYGICDLLIKNGVLERLTETTFIVLDKYSPPVERIISIEAKLSDWKGGLMQALRYKLYSHQSYLAISKEFSHRVDLQELKKHNIGLIEVSKEGIVIKLKPLIREPSNKTAYSYLSEKFYSNLNLTLS